VGPLSFVKTKVWDRTYRLGHSLIKVWFQNELSISNPVSNQTTVMQKQVFIANPLELRLRSQTKSLYLPLKHKTTRNVGQCPTWWSPCKLCLTLTTWLPCSNAAKTRKPLKFAGVPQTGKPISAASRRKSTILWGHVQNISLLNNIFPIVDTCFRCEDIVR